MSLGSFDLKKTILQKKSRHTTQNLIWEPQMREFWDGGSNFFVAQNLWEFFCNRFATSVFLQLATCNLHASVAGQPPLMGMWSTWPAHRIKIRIQVGRGLMPARSSAEWSGVVPWSAMHLGASIDLKLLSSKSSKQDRAFFSRTHECLSTLFFFPRFTARHHMAMHTTLGTFEDVVVADSLVTIVD